MRCTLALALFLSVGLVGASAVRAQDSAASVAPMAAVADNDEIGLKAYVAALPSAPTPKVEATASAIALAQSPSPVSIRQHAYWLDRKSLAYGLVQGGAEIFDGVTTRYFIHHCSHCFENDPMSRLLLGTRPSWGKMIPMGIAEAAVATYSYRSLSHSPNRILRRVAPLVPIGLTAVHAIEGARNISLKNKYRCADPGYVVVGAVCVPGPPAVLSVPTDAGGGLGLARDPR